MRAVVGGSEPVTLSGKCCKEVKALGAEPRWARDPKIGPSLGAEVVTGWDGPPQHILGAQDSIPLILFGWNQMNGSA